MKVGIVTFHNGSNYGAALQAFALQEKVKELYDEVSIINYKNRFIMKGLDKIRWGKSLHNIYYSMVDILNYKNNSRKIDRFKAFFCAYYDLTELLDAQELQTKDWHWDLCISGSDQIWNPLLNQRLDEVYFGQFSGVDRRISYASSTGAYAFDNAEWNKEFKEYLGSFDKISVRENADRIKDNTGIEALEVLDPTLLLTKEDWKNKLQLKEKPDENYVLVYAMNNMNNVIDYACRIAEQLNAKVWVIGNFFTKQKGIRMIKDAGPREFVELFYNAAYVVTNSFHGTAFSVNFQKQFTSIYNFKSPERAKHLLECAGLERYLESDLEEAVANRILEEEFAKAQEWLNEQRKEAEKFLQV